MSRRPSELTTTSFAILGLLAMRPLSTYELAKQMGRNAHYMWPRAESNLYAEPKRLVEDGYAVADSQPQGRRRRTVYSITSVGREALEHWVGSPSGPSKLESEPLVKFFYASYGSKAEAISTLRAFRLDADQRLKKLAAIFHEYLRGEDPYPERVHINVVTMRMFWAHAQTDRAWADWALDQVEGWPDTRTPHDRRALMKVLSEALQNADGSMLDHPSHDLDTVRRVRTSPKHG